MLKWMFVFGFSALSGGRMSGAPYCAYEVRVNKPSGVPFPRTPAGIVDNGTQISTAETDAKRIARLCDAPVHKVDIVAGAAGEGLTLVKGVKPTWPTTREIVVIRDDSHWDELTFADACQVLLHIQDERGRPVTGARFDGHSSKVLISMDASDGLGRLFRRLKSGGSLDGLIARQGFISVQRAIRLWPKDGFIPLRCTAGGGGCT